MCGIVLLAHAANAELKEAGIPPGLQAVCDRRGPDCQHTLTSTLAAHDARAVNVHLRASVLSLRGKHITQQPLRAGKDDGFMLAWNGQIFRHHSHMGEDDKDSPLLDPERNDGEELLREAERELGVADDAELGTVLVNVLKRIEGPYAFVLIDRHSKRIYFGRDPLGRRSLLMRRKEDAFLLCSVADQDTIASGSALEEVSCGAIWVIDLSLPDLSEPTPIGRDFPPLRLRDLDDAHELSTANSLTFAQRLSLATDFSAVLSDSVRRRVTNIRPYTSPETAHLAVLFSGGLDCATVALLAHRHLDPAQPIDLLNVALENPRTLAAARRNASTKAPTQDVDPYDVPDRQTGIATFRELVALAPERRWRFVKVDVPYVEYCAARQEVRATMYPSNSVMDLSIAAALFFAARGRGTDLVTGEAYETTARVLLSGLGADELLGGYSRHRAAFGRGGRSGLIEELQLDLDRLPTRNLGRDDRILSTHGREARYPFLDRAVLEHLWALRVEDKMELGAAVDGVSFADGERASALPYPGDKLLLRLVAGELLGLHGAARLKKRAIQFGARSAKIDEGGGGGEGEGAESQGSGGRRGKLKGHHLVVD